MYWRHFNLTAEPFSLTPDPSFLYLSPVHAEAYAALMMGLRERRGLITMIGEIGTGKTTLVYSVLSGLGPEIHTAYVSNARLSFDGIMRVALRDFGVPCDNVHSGELTQTFNAFLLDCANKGTTAALVIDEAQNLSRETFEDLRLLSNFETYTHKLLQIVLVGQPELDAKLRDPALRQVSERIAVRCVVNPLGRRQSHAYLEHRLSAVNGSVGIFTRPALRLLVGRSRGIPRSLNIIAHNSMLFAYGEAAERVSRRFVASAVREKEGRGLVRLWRRPRTRSVDRTDSKRRLPPSFWTLAAAAIGGLVIGLAVAGGANLLGRFEAANTDSTTSAVSEPITDQIAKPVDAPQAPPDERDEFLPPASLPAVPEPIADQIAKPAEGPQAPSNTEALPATPPSAPEQPETVLPEPSAPELQQPPANDTVAIVAPDAPIASAPAVAAIVPTPPATEEVKAVPAPVASPQPAVRPQPTAAPVRSRPAPRARVASAAVAAPPPAAVTAPPSVVAPAGENTTQQDRARVVTVPKGSSLSSLLLAVYGQYSSEMVDRMKAVNPQVTDPDFIVAGDKLRFPETSEVQRNQPAAGGQGQ